MAVDFGGGAVFEPDEAAGFGAMAAAFADASDEAAHDLAGGMPGVAGAEAEDHSAFVGGTDEAPTHLFEAHQKIGDDGGLFEGIDFVDVGDHRGVVVNRCA